MKLYSIAVIRVKPEPTLELASAKNLSEFSFFQRGSVGEFMSFFGKTCAKRVPVGQHQDIDKSKYVAHVYRRSEGLAGVIITDTEYPMRVAHTLIGKILDEYLINNPANKWQNLSDGQSLPYPELEHYMQRYQDPSQSDAIMRVQQDLDETKQILHKSIDQLLQRGEKLDYLVQRSDDLSSQSKMFFKAAKKQNSCCIVM